MPRSMEYALEQTILNGTGTFKGQCNVQGIQDSIADVTFRSKTGNVVKAALAIPTGVVFYNIVKVVLTSGCVSCAE